MTDANSEFEGRDELNFGEVIRGEFGDRVVLIEKLDACRSELAYQLTEVAAQLDIDPTGHGTLEIDVSEHRDAFKLVLRDILDDDVDTEDAVEYAVEMFAVESSARAEIMSKILNKDAVLRLSPESIMEQIGKSAAETGTFETMLDKIADFFEDDLRHDIDTFLHTLLEKHGRGHDGEDTGLSILEIKKELKDHLADVAKIAAGVTIALAVDKLLRRKT